jgi:glycosyltransferase involved in cell wall biosynthesis
MNTKKILFVSYTAVLGGGELCLLDFAHAYRETSLVVLLTDGILKNRLEDLGVKVEVLQASRSLADVKVSSGLASLKSIGDLWRLGKLIAEKSKDFDLIHANNQKGFVISAIARLFGGAPVVWHLHDILTSDIFSPTNRRIAVTLANWFATRVIVNSQATGEAFLAVGGKRQLLRTVYNGFNVEKFDQINDNQKNLREELGIPLDRNLIGMFSRLSYWKGQHILLEAASKLPDDVHVLLVGDALFGEFEYTEKLEKIAAMESLQGRVHWLGFRQDIPELMKACDAIAHCSTAPEPFGRVIVEAQLSKRPAIATIGGGTSEIIENGITGLLIPPNDPQLLADAMQEIFSDLAATQRIVETAYIQAQAKFSIPSVCQAFEMAIAGV